MTPEQITDFKKTALQHCTRLLEERIAHAQHAMKAAQEAANSEDKSSAGDKYETARAMGQLDRDMNAKQLLEARTALNDMLRLNIEITTDQAAAGSMVKTNNGTYFIAAGIGTIETGGQKIIVLSPKAPLAMAMLGKKAGDSFLFNNRKDEIKALM